MLEKELGPELIACEEILQNLSSIYPQMHLEYPLLSSDFEQYIPGMNSYELKFASFAYSMGLYVFREPKIDGCLHVPDFYIFNHATYTGSLVELTLYNRSFSNCNSSKRPRNEVRRTIERKKGQIQELESCGIPYLVLYREELEQIRQNYIRDFF